MRSTTLCTQPKQAAHVTHASQGCGHNLHRHLRLHRNRLIASGSAHRVRFSRPDLRSASASLQTASPASSHTQKQSRTFDVVALGNLCLDIVVSVPELPPSSDESRRQLLKALTAAPPPKTAWEVGGNTNFMIAAARLGLKVASIGHVGPDQYGEYVRHILQVTSLPCHSASQFCFCKDIP